MSGGGDRHEVASDAGGAGPAAAGALAGLTAMAPGPEGDPAASPAPGLAELELPPARTADGAGAAGVAGVAGLAGGTGVVGAAADPATEAALPAAPGGARAEGDEAWATHLGDPGVAENPGAIAVRGDEVWIGGDFWGQMAGMPQETYLRVAHWDGSSWRRMGDGADGPVRAFAVVGDDVYAGGEFTTVARGTVEASRLARWDGTSWHPVAGGVSSSRSWDLVSVRALACDGTTLWVAGTFDTAGAREGAIPAAGFAALDLATGTWETYDGGLGFGADPGEGRALALAGDRLYVGGSFDRAGTVETGSIAALDRASRRWEGFGAGVRAGDYAGTVEALAVDEATGTVYLGGRFTAAGPVATTGVATLGDGGFGFLGPFTYYGGPDTVNVVALALAGGTVYAAGVFTHAGDVEVGHWAAYDGTGWRTPAPVDGDVLALAACRDGVVVTGAFGVSEAVRLTHAGLWTGTGWQTFGQGLGHDPLAGGGTHAVAATASGVYAGGFFDQAGPVRVASVAEWREGAWHDVGGGVQMPAVLGTVHAMLGVGDDLYVTGQFESAGGVPATNIARWDGTRWSALGSGIQGGGGRALTMLGGRLYVGGSFFHAGEAYASNVAAWDPETEQWSSLGSVPTYDGRVMALAAIADRYLVIGGQFSRLWSGRFQASGQNSLVLFDTHWPPEPANPVAGYFRLPGVTFSWMPGAVRALQVLGGDLWVGGTFERAGVTSFTDPPGEGFEASCLAVWRAFASEEARWETPGGTDHHVTSFATLDGRALIIGGWFDHAGPVAASAVVEHDPAAGTWTPYGSGIGWGARSGPTVQALAQGAADGLWVGGVFTVAGGVPSGNIALWRGTAGRAP